MILYIEIKACAKKKKHLIFKYLLGHLGAALSE